MGGRGGGSRGSGNADAEWISRAIVGFGRYPNKRPSGLHVDSTGSFGLKELMKTWGKREGVTEDAVLGAVRAHMFHEGEGGALRFALGENEDGSIWIRVLPKRGHQQQQHQQQRACATPSRAQWNKQGNQWQQRGGSRGAAPSGGGKSKQATPPKLTPGPGLRGSVGLAPGPEEEPAAGKPEGSLQERLTMALDEMIAQGGRKEKPNPPQEQGGSPSMATKDKLDASLDDVIRSEDVEMKDASSDKKQAQSPEDKQGSWGRRGSGKASWGWNASDKWSRHGGGGKRSGRQSWSWSKEAGWQRRGGEDAEEEGADSRRGRSRSRSRRSPASSSGSRSRSSNSWRRTRGRRPSGREEDAGAAKERGSAPPRPPGDFWTKYQDDGFIWWHYTGPLGQWFCSNDGGEPTPYPGVES